MADYAKKIRTDKGDLQIDYTALANLPKADTTLKESGGFADAKVVGDKFTQLMKKNNEQDVDIMNLNNQLTIANYVTAKELENKGYITESTLTETLDAKGYVTETQLIEKKYVTETSLSEQGYVTTTELSNQGYVTETQLSNKGYVTETQLKKNLVASTSQPGVVKPGSGLAVSTDGTLSVNKHPLEDLSNIHVLDSAPDTVVNGHWYLIKVEE